MFQEPLAAAQKRPGFVSQEEEPGVVQEGRTGVCVFQQETRCCSTKGQEQGKGPEEEPGTRKKTRKKTRCCFLQPEEEPGVVQPGEEPRC